MENPAPASRASSPAESLPREGEIDGLRSLAIVPVVLYHAGWSWLPGGFVGVDIFFVISGYLITRILDREISSGSFSLARFYERRARRIMPALLLVVACTSIAAMFILLPTDLILYAKSLLYALFFASNVYFFQHTGYFDASADGYALLHTWSLAVEEQFYLLFPLFLLIAARFLGSNRRWGVGVVAVVSFAISVVATPGHPAFSFYLPFTRAWELMAGSLLALGAVPKINGARLREALAWLSLAAIVVTVLLLPNGTNFPGWIAAPTVLGAAGLIHLSPGTRVGKLLSLKPLVGIGLVSYSLYLWHWPLLVLAAYYLTRPLALWESTLLAGLALLLALATWKFVEQPFRNRSFWTRRTIFAGAAAGMATVSAFCVFAVYARGFPQRVSPEVVRLESFARDVSPKRTQCHETDTPKPPQSACALGADVTSDVAVWSDSHGVELSYALGELAKGAGSSVLELSSSACPPGLDYNPPELPHCAERNRKVLDFLLANPQIKTVVLAAARSIDDPSYLDAIFPGTDKAIAELRGAGRTVVLVYPFPRDRQSVPERLAREDWSFGHFDPELYPLTEYQQRLRNTLARMDALVQKYSLAAVRPTDALCPNGDCLGYANGKVLFFDQHHLSMSGARLVAPLFADVIGVPQNGAHGQKSAAIQ